MERITVTDVVEERKKSREVVTFEFVNYGQPFKLSESSNHIFVKGFMFPKADDSTTENGKMGSVDLVISLSDGYSTHEITKLARVFPVDAKLLIP